MIVLWGYMLTFFAWHVAYLSPLNISIYEYMFLLLPQRLTWNKKI